MTGRIPSTIGCLTELRMLMLHRNDLEGPVPEELGNCRSLEEIHLSFLPRLGGALPASFGGLQQLQVALPKVTAPPPPPSLAVPAAGAASAAAASSPPASQQPAVESAQMDTDAERAKREAAEQLQRSQKRQQAANGTAAGTSIDGESRG